jgi:hypothetical protein
MIGIPEICRGAIYKRKPDHLVAVRFSEGEEEALMGLVMGPTNAFIYTP